MGYYLLKPDPTQDFYIDWSSYIDDAIAWGDREFMLECDYAEDRLDRCDERGTSAYWFHVEPGGGEVWKNTAWLAYSQMKGFFDRIAELYPDDEDIPDELLGLHPELWSFLEYLDNEE